MQQHSIHAHFHYQQQQQQHLHAATATCSSSCMHAAGAACSSCRMQQCCMQHQLRAELSTNYLLNDQTGWWTTVEIKKRTKRKTKNSRITKCPRTHTRESERENVVEKREQKRNYKIYTTSENTGRGGIVVKLRKYLEFGLERERGRVNCRDQMYIVLSSFSIIG